MKKNITVIAFFLVGLSAKAQWYAVPDLSFQNWLTNNGYSGFNEFSSR